MLVEQSVRLGRVAGIPVGANWSVAVILVITAEILAVTVLPAAVPHRPAAVYWLVAVVGAFPVVEPGGRLGGLVLAGPLARVRAAARHELTVGQVALAVPHAYLATPGDPAGPLLRRRRLGGQVAAVVLADGRVAGLVTMADLGQALRWRGLARTSSG